MNGAFVKYIYGKKVARPLFLPRSNMVKSTIYESYVLVPLIRCIFETLSIRLVNVGVKARFRGVKKGYGMAAFENATKLHALSAILPLIVPPR